MIASDNDKERAFRFADRCKAIRQFINSMFKFGLANPEIYVNRTSAEYVARVIKKTGNL